LRIEPRFLGRSVSSSIEWKIITLWKKLNFLKDQYSSVMGCEYVRITN
jgi:hypothetical protein